jgi:hypothetical protein
LQRAGEAPLVEPQPSTPAVDGTGIEAGRLP